MRELISVIVPVNNGEGSLAKCVESIAAQEDVNLEILVVNDGSTDGTASVCKRLLECHPNLSVIEMPDLGVSAARNRGLSQAKGEYVTFVDADDRLRPGMLAQIYWMLQGTKSDLAGCRFVPWSTETDWTALLGAGKRPRTGIGRTGVSIYNNEGYLKEAILQGNTRCWSKLYRRDLIGPVRFREGLSVGEDLLFLLELLPRLNWAAESDYLGYGYYQNPEGVMNRPFAPAYLDQIACWEKARELIGKQDKSLLPQADAQIMVAVMLVAGKIALLPEKERQAAARHLRFCHKKLRAAANRKSLSMLPQGYLIKALVFLLDPRLYVRLYRLQKRVLPGRGWRTCCGMEAAQGRKAGEGRLCACGERGSQGKDKPEISEECCCAQKKTKNRKKRWHGRAE